MLACAPAWSPAQDPATTIDQIKQIDWRAILRDPQTRMFVASLVYRFLPDDLRSKVTTAQIDETLGVVLQELDTLPPNLSEAERAVHIAKSVANRLFPELAEKIQQEVQKALDSLPSFVREENGVWVVRLEKAGALRILYQQNRYPGLSTIIVPRDKIKKGDISLYAEDLTLRLDGSRLDARGDVRLQDERSYLVARELHYDGSRQALVSSGASLRLPSIAFDAGEITNSPDKLHVDDLAFKATLGNIPLFSVKAKEMNIEGVLGNAKNLEARILGIGVYRRDEQQFRLDSSGVKDKNKLSIFERIKRFEDLATLLKPPSVSFFSRTPSVSYSNQYVFGNRQLVSVDLDARRGQYFASDVLLTWNVSSDPNSSPDIIRTEYLRSAFMGGYVQNADVRTVDDFIDDYRRPRRTFGVGFGFNQLVELRDVEDVVSSPIIAGFEFGGAIGSFGGVGQIRYEQAKSELRDATQQRASFLGSLGLFRADLGPGLTAYGRLDAAGFKPSGEGYAWIRPVVSLQARILPQLYVSAAYVNGREFGTPFSIADIYLAGPEYHARLDLNLGPTQFTYVNRYSARRQSWYRSQVYFSQDIDAFRFFLVTDQQLSQLSFGLQLRVDEILDSLRRRRYTGVALDSPQAKR
jgi:hypothetical protein